MSFCAISESAHSVSHTASTMARHTRASSRLSAGKENNVASRPVIRLLLGFWRRLLNKYAIFSAFHKIIIKCLLVCDFLSIYAQEHRRRDELIAVSSKSKKIKKPQPFAPEGLLQLRAQLSRYLFMHLLSPLLLEGWKLG